MSVPSEAKVYQVTSCDYVVATSPEEAVAFRNTHSKCRPEEVLDPPVLTPLGQLVYATLPEEIENDEALARKFADEGVYRDDSYLRARPRTMQEVLDLHFASGFNIPAFVYCKRHFIHKYEPEVIP